jgi:hypothetical protein
VSLAGRPRETMILHLLAHVLGHFRERREGCGRAASRWTTILVALAAIVIHADTALASTTGWTTQPTARLARGQDATLNAVSCSSPMACMAVGRQERADGGPGSPLAERFNGARWTRETLPPEPYGELTAVSCSSSTLCLAVGSRDTLNPRRHHISQLVEYFDGKRWSALPPPAHSGEATLNAVSCAGSNACIAVGQPLGAPSLAERFDGRSLTAIPLPSALPTGVEGIIDTLGGISCTSPRACTAIGEEMIFWINLHTGGGEDGVLEGTSVLPLAEHWDGSSWNAEPVPASLRWGTVIPVPTSAISCAAEDMCIAMAHTTSTAAQLASFDGTSWISEPFSLPASHATPALQALSCSSPTACTAVGSVEPTGPILSSKAAALRFNGTTWRSQSLPAAVTRYGALNSVSCPTTRFCIAVGATGPSTPVAIRWSGGR